MPRHCQFVLNAFDTNVRRGTTNGLLAHASDCAKLCRRDGVVCYPARHEPSTEHSRVDTSRDVYSGAVRQSPQSDPHLSCLDGQWTSGCRNELWRRLSARGLRGSLRAFSEQASVGDGRKRRMLRASNGCAVVGTQPPSSQARLIGAEQSSCINIAPEPNSTPTCAKASHQFGFSSPSGRCSMVFRINKTVPNVKKIILISSRIPYFRNRDMYSRSYSIF